jgi:hypothetical protein
VSQGVITMTYTPLHESDAENQTVRDIRAKEKADHRVSMSRIECQIAGGWGATSQIEKENKGKLRRYLDGSRVRITSRSFYEHLIELAGAGPGRVRQPVKRFTARKHVPTQKELEGLRRGNERRAEEAKKRRKAEASPAD